ncbi:hypothetical protein FOA43_003696 [Brettanomyces nanus]|uniref:Ankyrin repeat-containing protein YAR1 n=1 Tax=Eeniella nana TaxID=13502 RepID=A0A875RQA1_EENNA|nr:uncharacterized protein FOA43_003696 [Brettanomyces nanus]QPG76310.1 hypothetical protein FOA43_003696 [Brettanomyces nanus]
MGKLTTLTQDEMDNVIFDARFGDLDSLRTVFTDEVEPSILPKIQDGVSMATPFHMAAANGHSEVLKYLFSLLNEKEINSIINKQNDSGNTALHWAAYNGSVESMRILCDHGADPFIKNTFKHDSFYEAQNNKHDDAEKYLLETFEDALQAAEGDAKSGDENENFDESTVSYTEGTEIQKIPEGGNYEEKVDEDVEFLKRETENLKV